MILACKEILVVDLDGTLLKSDTLYESFWSAFGKNWRTPFLSVVALGRGKAALKDYLRSAAEIDVSTLPYDEVVVAYIHAYRQQGGRVALVTASNQIFAAILLNICKFLTKCMVQMTRTTSRVQVKLRF